MSENVKKAPSIKELAQKYKVGAFFQKYTMVIALVLVVGFFALRTGGKTLFLYGILLNCPEKRTGTSARSLLRIFISAAGHRCSAGPRGREDGTLGREPVFRPVLFNFCCTIFLNYCCAGIEISNR